MTGTTNSAFFLIARFFGRRIFGRTIVARRGLKPRGSGDRCWVPSGNDEQFANLKPWPIEIVDLPIKDGD